MADQVMQTMHLLTTRKRGSNYLKICMKALRSSRGMENYGANTYEGDNAEVSLICFLIGYFSPLGTCKSSKIQLKC